MKRTRCVSSQKRSFPPSAQRSQNNTLVSWIYVESNPPPRRGGRGALMGRFFGNVIVRRRVRIYPARGRGRRGWEGNRHQPEKSPSNSVGARAGWGGGEGLYGRTRPVPCAHLWEKALTPPAPGNHKGLVKIPRIFLALPHIIHPRPYGIPGSRLRLMPLGRPQGSPLPYKHSLIPAVETDESTTSY